jgi:glutathione S-transferase
MATYRLHGRKQTGVMAIEAAMAEAGIPFDYVETPRPTTPAETAAFAAINPRLQVPVLVHPDGTVITEGPAMLVHLADANPAAGLIPPPGTTSRARHDRWLAFTHANIYEGMLRELYAAQYTTDPAGAEAVLAAASDYVRHHFQILEAELGPGPFLAGDGISVFDIYVWMLCYWIDPAWLATECPRLTRLWQTAGARPALSAVGERHFA